MPHRGEHRFHLPRPPFGRPPALRDLPGGRHLAVAGVFMGLLVQAWIESARRGWAHTARFLRAARRVLVSVGSGRREALIMALAYGLYSLVKGVWGGTLAQGQAAAERLIDLERGLGINIEPAWQRFFVDHHLGMPFWNLFYVVSQVVVLPLTLFLVFRYRRDAYAFVRNMAALSWTAGVVWYALQPVAPPRLLHGGLTDTVTAHTFIDLDSDLVRAFYNPVAAMPSLHVGMAPVVAWALWKLTPWLWTRVLGLLYPFVVTVCVIVTGNHFVLDAAGGLAVVLPAALIAALLMREPRGRPSPVAVAWRALRRWHHDSQGDGRRRSGGARV
ncbi:MAG: phosphatase PAP2 family protein [Thermoleophilia bacterium]